jgi:uridylate kinase
MKELESNKPETIVASVGGSALFSRQKPVNMDYDFVGDFREFCREQLNDNRAVIAVVGGGALARIRIADAKACGVRNKKVLDRIGIRITRANAGLVHDILSENGVPVQIYSFERHTVPGTVYLRGGTYVGHTSDYTTVQIAEKENVSVLLNIGAKPGLYPSATDGGFDESLPIIKELSFDNYFALFPEGHEPGENVPFEHAAAVRAKQANITVVLLGPDFGNIRKCLAGEEFTGTILRP